MSNKVTLFSAIKEALLDPNLAKADCAVYVFLLERSRNASARPSRARISQETGIHVISVTRCLRKLEDLGYLEKTPSVGKETNVYTLLRLAMTGSDMATPEDASTGSKQALIAEVTKSLPNRIQARLGEKSKAQTKGLHVPKHRPKTKPSTLHGAGSLQQTTR